MSTSLFRKEAVEHQQGTVRGQVFLVGPLSYPVVSLGAIFCALLFTGLLCFGTYTRKVTVPGYVVPDEGLIKIMLREPAEIAEIFVQEGQWVEKGTPLVRLSQHRTLVSGEGLQERRAGALALNEKALAGQSAQSTVRLKVQCDTLHVEINQARKIIEKATERLGQLQASQALWERRYTNAKTLVEKGSLSRDGAEQVGVQYLQQVDAVLSQQTWILERERELQQLMAQENLLTLDHEQQQWADEKERAVIEGHKADIEGSDYLLRAARAGSVTGLQATLGDWPMTAPLLTLTPTTTAKEAILFVPSQAIGFLEAGQTVRLRYTAFPYQRYGIYTGRVIRVAHHLLAPQELPDPVAVAGPVYKITVKLDSPTINAYGKALPVPVGTQLEADIQLEKKALWEWLLTPLYQFRGQLG